MTAETEFAYEPLTPVQVEQRLRHLHNEAGHAGNGVKAARQQVLVAQKAWAKANARALLSPDCPVVGRGPGEATVALRDAWVFAQTEAEVEALETAKTLLEQAKDYTRVVREQIAAVQSMNASVRDAYRTTGNGR